MYPFRKKLGWVQNRPFVAPILNANLRPIQIKQILNVKGISLKYKSALKSVKTFLRLV